jgi:hypothetical protein
MRLRLVLEDPNREWPKIDPERAAVERAYNSRDLAESLDRFASARRKSVGWLRGLKTPNWEVALKLFRDNLMNLVRRTYRSEQHLLDSLQHPAAVIVSGFLDHGQVLSLGSRHGRERNRPIERSEPSLVL